MNLRVVNIKHLRIDYITLTLLLMFIAQFLQNVLHMSSIVYFLIDIPIIVIFVKKIPLLFNKLKKYGMVKMFFLLLCLILISAAIGFYQNVTSGNIIYGIYKTFRGIMFFLCCLISINEKNVISVQHLLSFIFYLNAIVTFFQFIILGLQQDHLGGIFGTTMGVNQYTNLFFVVISVFIISFLFLKKMDYKVAFKYIVVMLMIAAIAELKFFYLEFAMIMGFSFFCVQKDVSTIMKIVVLFIITLIGYQILINFFPEFSILISNILKGGFREILRLQTHYSTDIDMGRLATFSYVNEHFFNNLTEQIFGLGIGNCTSSDFVDNSFYLANSHSHYDQFFTAYIYLELGWIGIGSFALFLLMLLVKGLKRISVSKERLHSIILLNMVLMTFMMCFYNNSINGQFCFLIYWALAVPIVLGKMTKKH